jgi:hypothetical protein
VLAAPLPPLLPLRHGLESRFSTVEGPVQRDTTISAWFDGDLEEVVPARERSYGMRFDAIMMYLPAFVSTNRLCNKYG